LLWQKKLSDTYLSKEEKFEKKSHVQKTPSAIRIDPQSLVSEFHVPGSGYPSLILLSPHALSSSYKKIKPHFSLHLALSLYRPLVSIFPPIPSLLALAPLRLLLRLLLFDLQQQRAVDMRQDTTERDRCADQRVQLLVSTDGKLQVTWCNALDFEILGCVAG